MGDRTECQILIPAERFEDANAVLIANSYHGYDNNFPSSEGTDLTCVYFSGVNYGKLSCEDELINLGIPFTWRWENGSEFSAGESHVRFTEQGYMCTKELYDDELNNVDLAGLIQHLNNYTDLRDYILKAKEDLTVLPWTNQVEYGKLYLLKQLISST